ncbi:hypothetical protein ACHAQH_002011 [Verticillium albo-atrum]
MSSEAPSVHTAEAVRDRLVNLALDLYRVRATHERYDGVDFGKIMRYTGPPGYQARDPLDNLTFVPWDLDAEIPTAYRHLEKSLQARIIEAHHIARGCTEEVSWKIHHLLDKEIEDRCLDEWESYSERIFPREVKFLEGLPVLEKVFDREDKMKAFQLRARIPEKVSPKTCHDYPITYYSQAKLVARWRIQNEVVVPSFESFWVHVATVTDGADTILIRKHLRKDVPLRDLISVLDGFLDHYQPSDIVFEKELETRLRTINYILTHGGTETQQEAIKLKESFKEIEHRRDVWEMQAALGGERHPVIMAQG